MSNILTHISSPPAEGNLYDEHGKALKLAIIQDCKRHKGMWTNWTAWQTYFISRWPCKWTKKLFFHLLDPNNLNSFNILVSCSSKLLHQLFNCHWQETWYKRQGWGALNSYHKIRMISPIPQLKGPDTHHSTGLWKGREFTAMCVLLISKKQECNSSVQNSTWVCMLLHVLRYIIQNSISQHHLTLNWKCRAHTRK